MVIKTDSFCEGAIGCESCPNINICDEKTSGHSDKITIKSIDDLDKADTEENKSCYNCKSSKWNCCSNYGKCEKHNLTMSKKEMRLYCCFAWRYFT